MAMRAANGRRRSPIAVLLAAIAIAGIAVTMGVVVATRAGEPGHGKSAASETTWQDQSQGGGKPPNGPASGSPAPIGAQSRQLPRRPPLVIAHRGASAYRPENTLAAFKLAIAMGADYIEGDLVVTRDGVLVVRHDPELSTTTDVASHPEFYQRRTTKRLDGSTVTGWFVEDFTLAEIKTLRAGSRGAGKVGAGTARSSQNSQGQSLAARPDPETTVPTVTEVINLAQAAGTERGRAVGLYFELKSPSYFRSIGLAPEPMLIAALRAGGFTTKDANVYVESFESESLRLVRQSLPVPLIQLLWGAGQPNDGETKPEALRAMAKYATGIGIPRARLRVPGAPETSPNGLNRALVTAVHQAGLELHVYTFEDKGSRADTLSSYQAYYAARVDAVFSDKPDLALSMRD